MKPYPNAKYAAAEIDGFSQCEVDASLDQLCQCRRVIATETNALAIAEAMKELLCKFSKARCALAFRSTHLNAHERTFRRLIGSVTHLPNSPFQK